MPWRSGKKSPTWGGHLLEPLKAGGLNFAGKSTLYKQLVGQQEHFPGYSLKRTVLHSLKYIVWMKLQPLNAGPQEV